MPNYTNVWGGRIEAACLLNCSPRTLKIYRDRGEIVESIHWRRLSKTRIEYNLLLLEDFMKKRSVDDREHLLFCKRYYQLKSIK